VLRICKNRRVNKMISVIIYGPPACGKAHNKAALANYFGCDNVVDG
jgi:replication-associated recombination protein RarA